MNSDSPGAPSQAGGPLSEELRVELEATRRSFHDLLAALRPDDWERPSLNPAWTIGELLTHITGHLFIIPHQLVLLQRQAFPDLTLEPAEALNEENVRQTRVDARGHTFASIAGAYEAGHAGALAALESVGDHEWQLGARMPDMGPTFSGEYRTIEGLFRYHARHFAEHAAQIQPVSRLHRGDG